MASPADTTAVNDDAVPSTSTANIPPVAIQEPTSSPPLPSAAVKTEQNQLNYGKRKIVVDILLHLNVYFFLLFWSCELLLYVYKGVTLPFPDVGGTLTLEIILLVFIALIEAFRLFFGYKGNLGERKQTLIWSVILSVPILVSQLYLILWQTYVLRVEVILCSIFFVMVGLEVLLSAATIWTFQRYEAFVHS